MGAEDAQGELERHQKQLRDSIAQSNRMIGEVRQRVALSRALTKALRADGKQEQG